MAYFPALSWIAMETARQLLRSSGHPVAVRVEAYDRIEEVRTPGAEHEPFQEPFTAPEAAELINLVAVFGMGHSEVNGFMRARLERYWDAQGEDAFRVACFGASA